MQSGRKESSTKGRRPALALSASKFFCRDACPSRGAGGVLPIHPLESVDDVQARRIAVGHGAEVSVRWAGRVARPASSTDSIRGKPPREPCRRAGAKPWYNPLRFHSTDGLCQIPRSTVQFHTECHPEGAPATARLYGRSSSETLPLARERSIDPSGATNLRATNGRCSALGMT